jgi:hypothetical protein
MRFALVSLGVIAAVCSAQIAQLPVTLDEMKYIRFVLLNVASLDNSPAAIQSYEDHLVKLHGLNAQESAVIRAAAQELKPLLTELRQSVRAISATNRDLSSVEIVALRDVEDRREQRIEDLARQILNNVRPETAARLRAPGRIVAAQRAKN